MQEKNTKKRIIDTGLLLFEKNGYDDVTVNDICEACNITKTTFYYHLSSKEQIVADFYDADILKLSEKLLGMLEVDNPWEQLMYCFDTLIDISSRIGSDMFKQLYIMNLKEDKGTFDFNPSLTNVTVALIEKGQRQGQIRNQSSAISLYRAASHTYVGYDVLWCIKNASFDRKIYLRNAMEDIFDIDPAFRQIKEAAELEYWQ